MNPLLIGARKLTTYRSAILVVVVMISLIGGLQLVRSQDPPTGPQTKEGKTRPTLIVPGGTVNAGEVIFKPDTDHDGMTDEAEAENGTNPADASDADGDADGDGLTNGDEVAGGSGVNNSDSDGDGISDGEEARLGYNPNDPTNTPPAGTALASLQVSPNPVNISINTLLGQEPVQLRVVGVRTDGTTANLTGSPTLTYQSLDEGVAIVDSFGNVGGTGDGQTNVTVMSGSVSADVPVAVTTLTPGALSAIHIPGYANNVDVAGDYAYVAAGSAGLVIVNVNDRSAPAIVATLNTPGNANDVRIVGTVAYVADGASGLQIINIANPQNPVTLGTLNTTGEAYDVVVYGTQAYVADGPSGLHIINVSNPAAPMLLGSVAMPGIAKGVDVSGDLVVVSQDEPSAVRIVDAAIPVSPQIAGTLNLSANSPGLDVEVRDRFAYVAAYTGGLLVVDFSIPASPRVIAGIQNVFYPRDVALARRYAMAAEVRFANAVPIIDLGDPSDPTYGGVEDFSPMGDSEGTGIAVDAQYIYMTGSTDPFSQNNGEDGYTQLFIGEYQQAANEISDTAGVAPTVIVDTPQSGQSTIEGSRLPISITATDDVKVSLVQLIVNGVVIIKDVASPYNIMYSVPNGVTSLAIEAKAFDVAGNAATSPPVTINVLPDTPPTISITNPSEGQILTEHQGLVLVANATDNGSVAQVVFTVNGATLDNFSFFTVPAGITSLTFEATATDNFGNTASNTRTVSVVPDTPPTITITSPAEGQVLTGEQGIVLIAEATDDRSVVQVVFTVNGATLNNFSSFTVPMGVTSLTFQATATDNRGQSASTTRTVTVAPDEQPPTVALTAPQNGLTVVQGRSVLVSADASDDIKVERVQFTVDGNVVLIDSAPPYEFTYTASFTEGAISIGAVAIDVKDKVGNATPVIVNVSPNSPHTNVIGLVHNGAGVPVANATAMLYGRSIQTDFNGAFSFPGPLADLGPTTVRISAMDNGVLLSGISTAFHPVQGGTTDVGTIVVGTEKLITTMAGSWTAGDYGDNGPALIARLGQPSGLARDGQGNLFILDSYERRVRRIGVNGVITTVAGGGVDSESEGIPATQARLAGNLQALAVDAEGNLYIGESSEYRIRKVGTDGNITTIAGRRNSSGSTGDGGPASNALFRWITGLTIDGPGNLYVVDRDTERIRKIGTDGIITTVAGIGEQGFSGDGGQATQARINHPYGGVVVDAQGNLFFTDTQNHRVRKVSPNGIITTVAGNGQEGYSGDGGSATAAKLNYPTGVTVDPQGNLFFADTQNHRVRRVSPEGIITTVTGTGSPGFTGDRGPAIGAKINFPWSPPLVGRVIDGQGNLYFADYGNRRVRVIW